MSDLLRLKSLGYLAPLSNYLSSTPSVNTGLQKNAQYYSDMPYVLWNHGLLKVGGVNARGMPKKFWARNPDGTTFNHKKLAPVEIEVFGLTPPGFAERVNVVEYVFGASWYKQSISGWQVHHRKNFLIASWDDPFGKKHQIDFHSIGGNRLCDCDMTYREYLRDPACYTVRK